MGSQQDHDFEDKMLNVKLSHLIYIFLQISTASSFEVVVVTPTAGVVHPFTPGEIRTDRFTENKGIYITSDADITVHGGNGAQSTNGGFLAIPLTDWSREFYVMSYEPRLTRHSQLELMMAPLSKYMGKTHDIVSFCKS